MGNPGSWNPDLRPGDNKWSCGVFARRPETGEAVWYYQWSPHDLFDHDGINECMLLDLKLDGEDKPPRKCLVHPGRTGYMYVIDRATGQVLSAEPFVRNTATKGVDLKTGRLVPNKDKEPNIGKVVRDITPVAPGAKDWQPSAYSPRTNLLYVPHQHLSMDWESSFLAASAPSASMMPSREYIVMELASASMYSARSSPRMAAGVLSAISCAECVCIQTSVRATARARRRAVSRLARSHSPFAYSTDAS